MPDYKVYYHLFEAEYNLKKLYWFQRFFRTSKAIHCADTLYNCICCVSQMIENAIFSCTEERKSWIYHLHRVEKTYLDLVPWHQKMRKNIS